MSSSYVLKRFQKRPAQRVMSSTLIVFVILMGIFFQMVLSTYKNIEQIAWLINSTVFWFSVGLLHRSWFLIKNKPFEYIEQLDLWPEPSDEAGLKFLEKSFFRLVVVDFIIVSTLTKYFATL